MDNQEVTGINIEGQRRDEEGRGESDRDRDGERNRHRDGGRGVERDDERDERDREGDKERAGERQVDMDVDRDQDGDRDRCHQCDKALRDNGELFHHMRHQPECMLNYTRRVLPKKNSGVYSRNRDVALFHLAARFNLCSYPGCLDNMLTRRGFAAHLASHRDCLVFYQREGSRLFQWEDQLSCEGVGRKVIDCRNHLKRDLAKEGELGPKSFKQEQVLYNICDMCLLQGPLLGNKSYDMDQVDVTITMYVTITIYSIVSTVR